MHTKQDRPQGIEQLFPLIGGDSYFDYRFGFFTTEESTDCLFRFAFNEHSKLFASGTEPELIIAIDHQYYSAEDKQWKIEEKQYSFAGRNDFDETKKSWFFQIDDKSLKEIEGANCITAIEIKKKRFRLDLYADSPDIWSSFFRAGVAECINEEPNSRDLLDFCIQYGLAKKKLQLEKHIDSHNIKPSDLAQMLTKSEGSIDMV